MSKRPPSNDDIISKAEEVRDAAKKKMKEQQSRNRNQSGARSQWAPKGGGPSDDKIDEVTEGIVDEFKKFLKPHPSEFDMFDTLEEILRVFGDAESAMDDGDPEVFETFNSAELEVITEARGLARTWDGAFADNLQAYLLPMSVIAANNGLLVKYLLTHAKLMRDVYWRQRDDVLEIGDQAIEAIEAIQDTGGKDFLLALSIALSILPMGEAATKSFAKAHFLKPGQTLDSNMYDFGKGAAAAGSSIGGNFVSDGEEVPLGGDDVEEVVDNIKDALKEVAKRTEKEEEHLIEVMDETADGLDDILGTPRATPLFPRDLEMLGASVEDIHKKLVKYE